MKKAKVLIGLLVQNKVAQEFFLSFYPAITLMEEEGISRIFPLKWGNAVNGRNKAVQQMMDEGGFTHLFFMDDDMRFPQFALSRLLAHDVDIVGGFYNTKVEPFKSTVFVEDEDGENWRDWNPSPDSTLLEVAAVPTGCMLIKAEVLESMVWPWFYYEKQDNGAHHYMTEDVVFCINARKAGYKVHCDPTVKCGHMSECIIEPCFDGDVAKVQVHVR